ncbi:MAG: DEAD/DEAH box helicase [Micromonosporaceae bacterium]|nr:DEAD/DEAH box helicase [Micromonosporaceae bacterium]
MPNESGDTPPDARALDHATAGAPEVEAVAATVEELAARAPVRPDSPTFRELGVRAETVEALESVGITRAFAIQEYAIPSALRGSDLIGQAPTGTGKTLGFGVPMLEHINGPDEGADGTPQALVVVPTRELCLQVSRDLEQAGKIRAIRVLSVYGGVAYEPQTNKLRSGVDLVVGTPGRLLDLAKGKQLRLDKIQVLVLDEADRMLDLGFAEDVEKILSMLPERRQTMLFSATMPDPIVRIARRFLHQPLTIHADHNLDTGPSPDTEQFVYRTHSLNKVEMVARILQAKDRTLTMVFCRTKRAAQKVAEDLDFRGFAAAPVHGDLGQAARERALRAFRSGKVDTLVATDVAARGLDVTGVSHVINYDCPEDPDTYVHRIGRTGRAGATGVAVTFVDWEDLPRWKLINSTLGVGVADPAETYHTSPHLYDDLKIPEDASGTLPTAQRTRAGLNAEKTEDIELKKRSRPPRRGARGAEPTGTTAERPRQRRQRTRRNGGPETGADQTAAGADQTPARANQAPARANQAPPARANQAPTGDGPARSDAAASADKPRRRRRRRRAPGAGGEQTGN